MQKKMLIVRNMVENDLDAIAALELETFSDAWTWRGILDTFHQKQAFVTVAEKDGQIAGYCIMYFALEEAEIVRIAVGPAFRRQGVGRSLLDKVEQICQEKGFAHLLLDVRESNASARAFYRDYGFGIDGIRKNFYDSPKESAVLMSKAIPTLPTRNHYYL